MSEMNTSVRATDKDCINAKMLETPSGQVTINDVSNLDSVVTAVLQKYTERSLFGKKKYGTDLDRKDLTIVEWVQHTQEELMDATLYLEKLKQTLIEKGLDKST
jgi:hypothetical protein